MYAKAFLEYALPLRVGSTTWAKGAIDNRMRNDQRQFYVFDLEVGAKKNGAVIPDMQTVLGVWNKKRREGRSHLINGGAATTLIGDMEIDPVRNLATILVRLSDRMAPNAVYSDPASNDFQELRKIGNQGADLGCHILISIQPENQFPNIYTCLIERIPGLSSSISQRLFSKLLNFEYNDNKQFYQYPHPNGGLDRNGQPRLDRCCPHIALRGRPSDTLINDINTGHLTGVSLVKSEVATPIGGAAYLTKNTSELRLAIDHNNLPHNIWDGLTRAFNQNSATYQKAKVAYKLPNSKRSVTVEIDSNTGAPLSDLYVKSIELTAINPLLAQSSDRIVPHLRDLAIPHLIAERDI